MERRRAAPNQYGYVEIQDRRQSDGSGEPYWETREEVKDSEWANLTLDEQAERIHEPNKGLPSPYWGARFRDFDLPELGEKKALYVCNLFAERWNEARAGLYVHGPTGVGKTHLLAATYAGVRLSGAATMWWSEDVFFDDVYRDYKERRDVWAEASKQNVVALDDFYEFKRWTEWKVEQMDRLIHRLYLEETRLIMTSNVSVGRAPGRGNGAWALVPVPAEGNGLPGADGRSGPAHGTEEVAMTNLHYFRAAAAEPRHGRGDEAREYSGFRDLKARECTCAASPLSQDHSFRGCRLVRTSHVFRQSHHHRR